MWNMRNGIVNENGIIALAYFHRYGWIAAMMICIVFWPEQMTWLLSFGCLAFSLWSFVGYKNKWKHIYCSFQNAYHEKMTPNHIQWDKIKKSDAYAVPLLFFNFGVLLLVVMMLH